MIVEAAKRIFKWGDVELPDPDPKMSVQQVQKFYADQYPGIINATTGNPEFEGDVCKITFVKSVGEFG